MPDTFADALRMIPSFTDSVAETRVVSFTQHPTFANVKTFQIQFRLREEFAIITTMP
jgi:hypothetical protein